MKYFLTIAASDNSGGAGVQQDIKVAHELGYWALSAITGITSQNFNNVSYVEAIKPEVLKIQLENCFKSFSITAIKIGALCSQKNIQVIAEALQNHNCKNVVLDPVLTSTDGKSFLALPALDLLKNLLFPLTKVITPNKPELELLTNSVTENIEDAIDLARSICNRWNTSVLIKGGHFDEKIIREALVTDSNVYRFERERKVFFYSHGTGCTLSTALACFLGHNLSLKDSYLKASKYLVNHYLLLQKKFSF